MSSAEFTPPRRCYFLPTKSRPPRRHSRESGNPFLPINSRFHAVFFDWLRQNVLTGLRNVLRFGNVLRGLRNVFRVYGNVLRGLRNVFRGLRNVLRGLRKCFKRSTKYFKRSTKCFQRSTKCFKRSTKCFKNHIFSPPKSEKCRFSAFYAFFAEPARFFCEFGRNVCYTFADIFNQRSKTMKNTINKIILFAVFFAAGFTTSANAQVTTPASARVFSYWNAKFGYSDGGASRAFNFNDSMQQVFRDIGIATAHQRGLHV